MSGSRYSWGFRGASRIPNNSSWPDSLQVGQWRDVLPLFEGKIKVRFRITDFPGETVLHCHFLRHEDLGMMDTILVTSGKRSAATAAPSSPPALGAAPPPAPPRAPPAAAKPPSKGSDASETATSPASAQIGVNAAASKSLSITAAVAATVAIFLTLRATQV